MGFSRKPLSVVLSCLAITSLLVVAGCSSQTSGSDAGGQQRAANLSDPTEFLKWSMDRYAALQSLRADCTWEAEFGQEGPPTTAKRTLAYSSPNKYRVVTSHGSGLSMTAVSDGKETLDSAEGAGDQAMKSRAPKSISDAESMFMQHPMFCGSLLYRFFGGSAAVSKVVDSSKQPIAFGPDARVDGDDCKTVTFFAVGSYGKTEVAIRPKDGIVRRIRYGSEPLLAMMQDQLKRKAPGKTTTTETYSNIVSDQAIPDADFAVKAPAGKNVIEMPSAGEAPGPPVPLGNPAPDFSVTGMDGKSTKLSSMRGRVVLIDFWATWCPPCVKGLPETNRFHKELSGKGLSVMAISDEKREEVAPFIKKAGYTFPTYLDTSRAANNAYKIQAIPAVAIIDREGKLASFMVGLQPAEKIREELKKVGIQ